MPTWTTPKTNWVGTDYFYASDWLRIVGNLEYITDALGIAYTPYTSVTDGDTLLTSADRNVVTELIEEIAIALHTTWSREIVKPREDYGSTWSSRDLNIIEKTLENFKAQIDGTLVEDCDVYADDELSCGDILTVGLL